MFDEFSIYQIGSGILEENASMKKVKITVLKKEFYADFAEKYLTG